MPTGRPRATATPFGPADQAATLAEIDRLLRAFSELRELRIDQTFCRGDGEHEWRTTTAVRGGWTGLDQRLGQQAVENAGRLLRGLTARGVVRWAGDGAPQSDAARWFSFLASCNPPDVETRPEGYAASGWCVLKHQSIGNASGISRVALERLRAVVADVDTRSDGRGEKASGKTDEDAHAAMEQFLEAIGDSNAARIHAIATSNDYHASEKMELIARMDQRYEGKSSKDWAKLLGISAQAVRQTEWWRVRRPNRRKTS